MRRLQTVMPYSEVCMHMRIAGKRMEVEIVGSRWPVAQVYGLDGRRYGAPITLGEAGVRWAVR